MRLAYSDSRGCYSRLLLPTYIMRIFCMFSNPEYSCLCEFLSEREGYIHADAHALLRQTVADSPVRQRLGVVVLGEMREENSAHSAFCQSLRRSA